MNNLILGTSSLIDCLLHCLSFLHGHLWVLTKHFGGIKLVLIESLVKVEPSFPFQWPQLVRLIELSPTNKSTCLGPHLPLFQTDPFIVPSQKLFSPSLISSSRTFSNKNNSFTYFFIRRLVGTCEFCNHTSEPHSAVANLINAHRWSFCGNS